jgi:hypothetical protein
MAPQIQLMRDKSVMLFGARRKAWANANAKLDAAMTDWARAARAADTQSATTAATAFRTSWSEVKKQYPAEALQPLPALWTCPMHPEVMSRDANACPTCGMPLEPIYETQPQFSGEPIIRIDMAGGAPVEVGKEADLRMRLSYIEDGQPVGLKELEEVHTRKIHLLILDLSETDYHHVHPEPTDVYGEYSFKFTPHRGGPYRMWADLKPTRTRVQQFAVTDIAARVVHAQPAGIEPESRRAVVDGYTFDLSFDAPVIHAAETVGGKLHVTGPDGQPFTKLEVVMGAFGHLVGFRQHSSVLHIHPLGRALEPPDALGGPDLSFYFRSNEPGLIRFFTQVKIGGRDLYPRFIVDVQPRPQLAL